MNKTIGALLCKLPRWLGGGHKERRLYKDEMHGQYVDHAEAKRVRICVRCNATRLARARKGKA